MPSTWDWSRESDLRTSFPPAGPAYEFPRSARVLKRAYECDKGKARGTPTAFGDTGAGPSNQEIPEEGLQSLVPVAETLAPGTGLPDDIFGSSELSTQLASA